MPPSCSCPRRAALARAVERAIALLLAGPSRARAIIREAFAARGGILTVRRSTQPSHSPSRYAAEHVLVCCRAGGAVAARVRNAGTIFIGATSSVSFGDYMTGANHVLPTGGLARGYSGSFDCGLLPMDHDAARFAAPAARSLALDVGTFADAEGLPGHAAAARQWSKS